MASGLTVDYYKSCLMGVNVDSDFMAMACNFLNCSEGAVSFKYLGLPVGANPLKLATWEPLLVQLSRRLNAWGNKHVSLGGRIVLLNSVINAIPIFCLSYLKMSAVVLRKLVKIQRIFFVGRGKVGKEALLGEMEGGVSSKEIWRFGSERYKIGKFEFIGKMEMEIVTKWRGFVEIGARR